MMGCDSPIQASARISSDAKLRLFLLCRRKKTPEPMWVRRVANILNKHTIPVIAINLLTTRYDFGWFFV